MSDNMIYYNGSIVEFSGVNSGYVVSEEDKGYFFIKLEKNKWNVVVIENIKDEETIKKLNFVRVKANTSKINSYYIDLLMNEFPNCNQIMTDAQVFDLMIHNSLPLGDKHIRAEGSYIVDKGGVIVDRRYRVGEIIYIDGVRYKVSEDSNGEGYIELEDTEGYEVVDEGARRVVEKTHPIQYDATEANFTALSSIYFDYFNGGGQDRDKLVVSNSGDIVRRLEAISSNIRYWECFDFVPGYRVEVTPTQKESYIGEVELRSR